MNDKTKRVTRGHYNPHSQRNVSNENENINKNTPDTKYESTGSQCETSGYFKEMSIDEDIMDNISPSNFIALGKLMDSLYTNKQKFNTKKKPATKNWEYQIMKKVLIYVIFYLDCLFNFFLSSL